MAKYKLETFTPESLAATKLQWESIAGADAFDAEYSILFGWIAQNTIKKDQSSHYLALCNQDIPDRVDAIVELVDSRKGALSKMLNVATTPLFWDVNNSRDEIVSLYLDVFFQVIKTKALDGGCRTVKLYGRSDEMLSLLRSIHSHWTIPDTSADFEGRFLTITLNQTE